MIKLMSLATGVAGDDFSSLNIIFDSVPFAQRYQKVYYCGCRLQLPYGLYMVFNSCAGSRAEIPDQLTPKFCCISHIFIVCI